MKTPYTNFKLVTNATLEERLDFFEQGFREIAQHETLCESRSPHLVKTGWWGKVTVTYPHGCDCWLSEPFGAVGLRFDTPPNPC